MIQDDNRCAEDFKSQHLQLPLIPESIVRDVREVKRLLGCGYIPREKAEEYLEKIEKELLKFQSPT
jgi:hypothetical protein